MCALWTCGLRASEQVEKWRAGAKATRKDRAEATVYGNWRTLVRIYILYIYIRIYNYIYISISDSTIWSWYANRFSRLPSGKRLHNYGKIHHFSWENSRTQWWFSIVMWVMRAMSTDTANGTNCWRSQEPTASKCVGQQRANWKGETGGGLPRWPSSFA